MYSLPTVAQTFSRPCRPTGNGFVLIEVLVSLTVFAVGIMAVLTAVLSALDLQKDATLRYRAGLILQEKLAQTVFEPYGGIVQGVSADGVFSWKVVGEPWNGSPQAGGRQTVKRGRTGKSRNRETREAPEPGDISGRLFQVAVDVSWRTGDGTRRITATQLVHTDPRAGGTP